MNVMALYGENSTLIKHGLLFLLEYDIWSEKAFQIKQINMKNMETKPGVGH